MTVLVNLDGLGNQWGWQAVANIGGFHTGDALTVKDAFHQGLLKIEQPEPLPKLSDLPHVAGNVASQVVWPGNAGADGKGMAVALTSGSELIGANVLADSAHAKVTAAAPDNLNHAVVGKYGTLKMDAQGNFSYTVDHASSLKQSATDAFSGTINQDGAYRTALTITVNLTMPVVAARNVIANAHGQVFASSDLVMARDVDGEPLFPPFTTRQRTPMAVTSCLMGRHCRSTRPFI
ncbi:MAG: VCBS domain-containing protein [Steroidobacteraceae bacterium]